MRIQISAGLLLASSFLLTACGSNDAPDTLPSFSPGPTEVITEFPSPSGGPEFPAARSPQDLEQGGSTWALVIAAAKHRKDFAITNAVNAAKNAGYDQVGPTDCDEGAAKAVGKPDNWLTVSVYYDSEQDAKAARDSFAGIGVSGTVAQVKTYCLD